MILAYEAKSHIFKVTFFARCVLPVHAFLFRSALSLNSWRTFLGEKCSCFAVWSGIKLHYCLAFNYNKPVFQAKQQPLVNVIGAAWPEWSIRTLLDGISIETCSVTYHQALQSPVYSMFKCCVNIAFALPFIFVSLLPWCCQTMLEATAGLSVQACTGAHLPAGWLKCSGGEQQPGWWKASSAVHRVCLSQTAIGCSDF